MSALSGNDATLDTYRRRLNRLGKDRQVVQAFLDKEADNAVRVEQEVAATGVLIPDYSIQCLQLRRLRQREHAWRQLCGRALRGRGVLDDHV